MTLKEDFFRLPKISGCYSRTPLFGHVIDEDYVAPTKDGLLKPGAEEVHIPRPVNQPLPPPPPVHQPPPLPQVPPPPPIFQPPPNPPSPPPPPPPLSLAQQFDQQAPEFSAYIHVNDLPDLGDLELDFDMEVEFPGYNERMMQVPSGLLPRQLTFKIRLEEDVDPDYVPPTNVQRTIVDQDVSTSRSQSYVDNGKSVIEHPPQHTSPQTPITQTPITEFLSINKN